MKTINKGTFIMAVLIAISSLSLKAQDTLNIATSAQCSSCKKLLEHDLKFEKGVESAILDIDTKVVTIIYNQKKTTPDKLRIAISNIGYDADSLKANPKAYNKLDECCKKEGHKD